MHSSLCLCRHGLLCTRGVAVSSTRGAHRVRSWCVHAALGCRGRTRCRSDTRRRRAALRRSVLAGHARRLSSLLPHLRRGSHGRDGSRGLCCVHRLAVLCVLHAVLVGVRRGDLVSGRLGDDRGVCHRQPALCVRHTTLVDVCHRDHGLLLRRGFRHLPLLHLLPLLGDGELLLPHLRLRCLQRRAVARLHLHIPRPANGPCRRHALCTRRRTTRSHRRRLRARRRRLRGCRRLLARRQARGGRWPSEPPLSWPRRGPASRGCRACWRRPRRCRRLVPWRRALGRLRPHRGRAAGDV